MIREMFKAQGSMFREVIASQAVALRAVRSAVRVGGDDDADGDGAGGSSEDAELDRVLRDALAARGFPVDGLSTAGLLKIALAPKQPS
jgi:hypothetical protein